MGGEGYLLANLDDTRVVRCLLRVHLLGYGDAGGLVGIGVGDALRHLVSVHAYHITFTSALPYHCVSPY